MQYEGVLLQLRDAVVAVESSDLVGPDVDALTVLMRRLDVVYQQVLSQLDDVAAARCVGSSVRSVRAQRAAVRKVASSGDVASAVASGSLSLPQAEVIAGDLEVASELLAVAAGKTPEELRREASRLHEQSGESEADRYQRQCRKRDVRSWVDGDGLVNVLSKFAPDRGAVVLAALRNRENRLARADGASGGNHRADALYDLIMRSGSGSGSVRTVVNVHVDRDSLNRGWVEGDGFCEVAGLGSIPVAKVRSCFDEAVLRVLVTSNNKLEWVGQAKPLPQRVKDSINAHNRDRCSKCGEPRGDVDHRQARVHGGTHDIANLQSLCDACHGDKTVNEAPWSAKYYEDRQPRAG